MAGRIILELSWHVLDLMMTQTGTAGDAQKFVTRLMPQATAFAEIWFDSHRLQDPPDLHRLTHLVDGVLSEERSPTEIACA